MTEARPPQINQRVKISEDHYDKRLQGRAGEVVKVPKLFPDHVYVRLDMRPRERKQKTELVDGKYMEFLT